MLQDPNSIMNDLITFTLSNTLLCLMVVGENLQMFPVANMALNIISMYFWRNFSDKTTRNTFANKLVLFR